MRNFYEELVIEAIDRRAGGKTLDDNLKEDLACLALNRLPPKYYRYEVDLQFFMSDESRKEMERRVEEALEKSIEFLNSQMQVVDI